MAQLVSRVGPCHVLFALRPTEQPRKEKEHSMCSRRSVAGARRARTRNNNNQCCRDTVRSSDSVLHIHACRQQHSVRLRGATTHASRPRPKRMTPSPRTWHATICTLEAAASTCRARAGIRGHVPGFQPATSWPHSSATAECKHQANTPRAPRPRTAPATALTYTGWRGEYAHTVKHTLRRR